MSLKAGKNFEDSPRAREILQVHVPGGMENGLDSIVEPWCIDGRAKARELVGAQDTDKTGEPEHSADHWGYSSHKCCLRREISVDPGCK